MNTKDAIKQYCFTKKDTVLIKYFNWFKGVKDGFPNGSTGIKSKDLKVSKIKAVLQRGFGEEPPSIWLKRFSPSERSWNLTRVVALPFLVSEPRLFIGSLNKKRFVRFLLYLPLPISSLVMGRLAEVNPKEIAIISLILTLMPRR